VRVKKHVQHGWWAVAVEKMAGTTQEAGAGIGNATFTLFDLLAILFLNSDFTLF
jgi:hypothetical protein